MDKQIIEINNDDFTLELNRGLLSIRHKDNNTKTDVPLDSILSIVLSANKVVLTKNIINAVCDNGGNIILCDSKYLPKTIIHSYSEHWLVATRAKKQIDASLPLQKKLWKNIVQHKILNQAEVLETYATNQKDAEKLINISKRTLSGDTSNTEAQAARIYFKSLFGKDFVRNRDIDGINTLLNYTYTVLRAIVARSVIGNGLLPYFGINHCMRSNTMPLVDDLIEPFRPVADTIVYEAIKNFQGKDDISLSPETKHLLTRVISYPVKTKKGKQALSDSIYDFVGTLVKSFEQKKVLLEYPTLLR